MEKPVIFNSEMIMAILADRKFMTRRVIKPQPTSGIVFRNDLMKRCPYETGQVLWVREAWCVHQRYDAIPPRILPETKYLQNGITYLADVYKGEKSLWMRRTRPSIFMPRWASRINLEITDIRAERLQDITEADALAEGIGQRIGSSSMGHTFTAIEHFHALWDSINKKKGFGFDVNPWVFVISFKRIT